MSFYDREYDSRLSSGNKINPLVFLIAINMIIFVTLAFFKALVTLRFPQGEASSSIFFDNNILKWFALSCDLNVVLTKPWTILTHAFVHTGIWALFGNMLWLLVFGYVFTDLTGKSKLAPIYIYGALMGAISFLLVCQLFPAIGLQNAAIPQYFGAGASVMAIAVAVTTLSPGYKIFPMLAGGIPIWFITLLYVVINLSTIPVHYPALHIAHITGGITGLLFIVLLRKGYDFAQWMNTIYDRFINLFNPDNNIRKPDFKKTLFYNSSSDPFTIKKSITQQKIDEILDKISRDGFDNLSQEEKDILQRAGSEEINDHI